MVIDTGRHAAAARAGLFDRLVARSDVASRSAPPMLPFAVMAGIVMVSWPIGYVTHSRLLAGAIIALLAIFGIWLVAAFIRKLYCLANRYVSTRWLAAATATYGHEVLDAAFARLRDRRLLDDVLVRQDLIEAIVDHRAELIQVRKAAAGVCLRDVIE